MGKEKWLIASTKSECFMHPHAVTFAATHQIKKFMSFSRLLEIVEYIFEALVESISRAKPECV